MSYEEGLRRIARAVRWIGDGIAACIAVWAVWFVFIHEGFPALSQDSAFFFFLAFAAAGIVMMGGRLLDWIIRGFAEPSSKK